MTVTRLSGQELSCRKPKPSGQTPVRRRVNWGEGYPIRYHRKMQAIISISRLSKTYASGFHALKNISLDIRPG